MPRDFAIHSDLLVHWTGKDIDSACETDGVASDSTLTPDVETAYLERLRSILKYGLWMTMQPGWTILGIEVPPAPALCFTELRLSRAHAHAQRYGRLGIGVKRPFVLHRRGRPVVYFEHRFADDFLAAFASTTKQGSLLQFFKFMDDPHENRGMTYKFYSESEWRILGGPDLSPPDPRLSRTPELQSYFASLSPKEQEMLRFLIPLDGWFSAIVYPNLRVKLLAQGDPEIRELIRAVKHSSAPCIQIERENLPLELDLELCKNL